MISFAYGSQSYFDQMVEEGNIVADSLYFINDTQRIYRGSELIVSTQVRFISNIPEPDDIVPDTVYVYRQRVEEQVSMTIYVSEGHTLIPISNPGHGGSATIDSLTLYNMLAKLTSKDVKEGKLADSTVATDGKLITAGAVRQALEWEAL